MQPQPKWPPLRSHKMPWLEAAAALVRSATTSEHGNREKAGAQNTQGEDAEGKSSGYGTECFGGLT